MKKRVFLPVIILFTIFSGCGDYIEIFPADEDREFDTGSFIVFPELNEQLINDLDLLGRIWGFLKYHHPEVGKGNYNWDYELFRLLPRYLQVKNIKERDKVLLEWIKQYGEIPVCTSCRETHSNAFIKPNLLWAENSNMNSVLKEKITYIYKNRHQGDQYYIKMSDVGAPEFLNEISYSNMIFPDAGYRLLACYRFWNMIQYFFPYKYLTDKNWDDALREYIPIVLSAENRLEYELKITQLICEINDSHANYAWGGRAKLDELRGSNYAPFQVRFIEGKLVVTLYYNSELKETASLDIGDIITHINGETVESIVENRKKYYLASNEASSLRFISYDLLRSNQNTITVSSEQAGQMEIQLFNRYSLNIHSWTDGWYRVDKSKKCYRFIDENIGYVTLASIKEEDVSEIRSYFANTKGIIIDIRNYPASVSAYFSLSSFFVSGATPFAKQTKGNSDHPGAFTLKPVYQISNTGGNTYKGKLMVLINEITFSNGEYAAMAYRAGSNTTIIGSTTAGAVGKNPKIVLPGGLTTTMTGLGTYYPDGRETQRIGIIPDFWLEPTIEGIREGRDELLEMAIKLINEQ